MNTDERGPLTRWQEGTTRIIALELAGRDVPEAWRVLADALYDECVRLEIARREREGQA